MTISPAAPSSLPLWIASQISMERALACCSCLEGVFYSSLKAGSLQSTRWVRWMRETSIAHIHKIQTVFNLANLGMIFVYSGKLLEKKYSFSFGDSPFCQVLVSQSPFKVWGTIALIGTIALSWITLLGMIVLLPATAIHNKQLKRASRTARKEGDLEISQSPSFQQSTASYLHIAKLVISLAFACFAKNPFWLVLGMAGTLYSFWKNSKIKWLNFSRVFPLPRTWYSPEPRIRQVKITYNMLTLPADSSLAKENCSICIEPETDIAFCANHAFHQQCLISVIQRKSSLFAHNNFYRRIDTRYYVNHVYTNTTYSYSVRIPQENLPLCPNCREFPLQNGCDVLVSDADHGDIDASVHVERPPQSKQFLFETLYATYNVVQAGLSYLQRHPTLAATIFKVQQLFLITDLVGYGFTLYFLYDKLKSRYGSETAVVFGVGAAVVAALSYAIIIQVNAYLKSALILKDLLAKLPLSPEFLKATEMSWGVPSIHQFMQWLSLNRAAASLALAYFSKTNLISAVTQLFSLWNISQLRWIHVLQHLKPFKNLTSLTIDYHFMVDPSCIKESFHLQSVLKSISKYCTQLLSKSSWYTPWWVKLRDTPLQPCECTLAPTLTNLWMRGTHAQHGSRGVDISWP